MSQTWKKLGQIYEPASTGRHPNLISHAANPLPVHLTDDIYRIFYSGRDHSNRSSVGAVDVDIVQRKVITDHYLPFFSYGAEDSFFSHGVSIGNCYEVDGCAYMLFMGWQVPPKQHWRGDIGRLVLTSDLSLELDSPEPFMGISSVDPISLSYPWVMPRQQGGFDMWYGSTLSWDAGNHEMLHIIHHAFSEDGHTWHRDGLAVPYEIGKAQAFSRPTVVHHRSQGLEMWFSYRSGLGDKYRIGYATSPDAKNWTLQLEDTGITTSEQGWDSEMIEYPFVFDHDGSCYMLYNGNGYGKTGFGLAVLEQD